MILNPESIHAGKTEDLGEVDLSMWSSGHDCGCGAKNLPESTRAIYCYRCEVYWPKDKLHLCAP